MLGLDYAEQLKQKEAAVRKLVGKYGPVAPIRGAENPCHYRNKVISTFAAGPGGKLVSGIYAAGTHKVLPVESCLLQDEVLDTVMQAVRAAASACRYQPYNEDKGTGLLRHCLLRRGVVSGQVMVVLVTAQPVLPGAKNFVRALLAEAEKRHVPVTTVVQNYNPRRTSVVLGEAEKVLYGKGFILDTLCGKTYAISPRSFYQINHAQTEVLYGLAVDAAKLTEILEAGRVAPTAKNFQEQRIYVLQSEESLAKLDKVTPCRYGAPTCLVVAFDKNSVFTYPGGKRDSGVEDAAIVATHLMLAAANAGVDSCWLNFFDPDELAKELGYDAGFGAGKYADDVASFAVTEMVKRGMK